MRVWFIKAFSDQGICFSQNHFLVHRQKSKQILFLKEMQIEGEKKKSLEVLIEFICF